MTHDEIFQEATYHFPSFNKEISSSWNLTSARTMFILNLSLLDFWRIQYSKIRKNFRKFIFSVTFEFSNFGQKCWFFEFLDVSNFVPSSKQVYIMLFNLISYPCFDVSFEFRNNLFRFVTVREFEITLKIGSDSDILNLDRFSILRDSRHDFPDLTSSFYNILQSATTSFKQQY